MVGQAARAVVPRILPLIVQEEMVGSISDKDGSDKDVPSALKVPSWVSQDDTLQSVQFTTLAKESLIKCIQAHKLAPLYNEE